METTIKLQRSSCQWVEDNPWFCEAIARTDESFKRIQNLPVGIQGARMWRLSLEDDGGEGNSSEVERGQMNLLSWRPIWHGKAYMGVIGLTGRHKFAKAANIRGKTPKSNHSIVTRHLKKWSTCQLRSVAFLFALVPVQLIDCTFFTRWRKNLMGVCGRPTLAI